MTWKQAMKTGFGTFSIRNKLLFGYLTIGLVPIIVIALIVYKVTGDALSDQVYSRLENERDVKKQQILTYVRERETDLRMLMDTVDSLKVASFNKLNSVQENKKAQIEKYFNGVAANLSVLAANATMVQALLDFESTFRSGEWDLRLYSFFQNEKYNNFLNTFLGRYGYYDVMLISNRGQIVFSSRREPDLGAFVTGERLADSGLNRCFSRSLTGLSYVDFSPYPPSQNRYIGFLGNPVKDSSGRTVGVLAVKISGDELQRILSQNQGMGRSGESFLSVMAGDRVELRSDRPAQNSGMGDTPLDPFIGRAFAGTIAPVIRIFNQQPATIAAYDPVDIFGTVYVLKTHVELAEVIDPRQTTANEDLFRTYVSAYGFANLYLISPQGQVFHSIVDGDIHHRTDLSDKQNGLANLFRKVVAGEDVAFVDFSLDKDEEEPYAFLGAAILTGENIDMVVALKLPSTGVNQIMRTNSGLPKTADLYLVGPDRLLRSDSFLLPELFSVRNTFHRPAELQITTEPSERALGGLSSMMDSIDYRGVRVLSAFAPLPVFDTTWAVLAEVDHREAFAPLRVLGMLIVLCGIVGIAIISLFSLLISRRIAGPILALKEAAETVRRHDFDVQVAVPDTGDEVQLLAEAFNSMTDRIGSYASSLEEKVIRLEAAEWEMRRSQERFRALVESTSDWIWEVDGHGRYTYVSPKVKDILGYTQEEVLGKTPFSLMAPTERERLQKEFAVIVEAQKPFAGLENTNIHKDGHQVVLETSGVPFFDESGVLAGFRGVDRDISKRKTNEQALLLSESVFLNTIEGIAITDREGTIQRVNQAFSDITGYTEEEVIGQNPRILKSDRHDDEFYRLMWQDLMEKKQWSGEIWNRRKDGSAYPEWLSIAAIENEAGEITNFVSLFHDISENKMQEEQLQFLAFHDPLTKLPNRKLLYDRVKVALSHARRTGKKVGLLYMDLDNFKNINDSYGHPFGDEFLCRVKDRIATVCRDSDTFARYGGDEFVIVLNDIYDGRQVSVFAERIIDLFKQPLTVLEEDIYTSVSIGVAVYPDDGEDLVTLEKNADMALYEAKKHGKRRSFVYQEQLKERVVRKVQLENEMQRAVADFSSFSIVYQPKVELKSGSIDSVEALLRWQVDGKPVGPNEFIPIAEETNLILPIGEWLMEKAMSDIAHLHRVGVPEISLAINLSTKQFNDENLFTTIDTILARTQFSPARLCFEITESIPLNNIDRSIAIMERLRDLGIKISMDDFGTGYSSLSYLNRLPLKELKIDRAFIQDIPANKNNIAISKTIIQMAKSLNFEVVAEGVETEEQLAFLRDNGCYLVQGFYFYRPMPFHRLLEVVAAAYPGSPAWR